MRTDDRREVIVERLRAYEEETLPILEVFRGKGKAIYTVQGGVAEESVALEIFELLERI